MTAVFSNFSVINVYAPTNKYLTTYKAEFYNNLNKWMKKCSRSKPIILTGDFNATISKDDSRHSAIGNNLDKITTKTNENGEFLLNLPMEHDTIIANTLFKKNRQKLTFKHLKGLKSTIDYITIIRI